MTPSPDPIRTAAEQLARKAFDALDVVWDQAYCDLIESAFRQQRAEAEQERDAAIREGLRLENRCTALSRDIQVALARIDALENAAMEGSR